MKEERNDCTYALNQTPLYSSFFISVFLNATLALFSMQLHSLSVSIKGSITRLPFLTAFSSEKKNWLDPKNQHNCVKHCSDCVNCTHERHHAQSQYHCGDIQQ